MKKNRYEVEYETSKKCFWDPAPAKYVKIFCSDIQESIVNYKVLDLGAGEGKNSVFLASKGATVTAVDISDIALSRFKYQPNYSQCKERITSIKSDVRTINFGKNEFDLIVAYGIFHALENIQEIYSLITKSSAWLKNGGYYIIVTFTNELPPPPVQEYLNYEAFVDYTEFTNSFSNMRILIHERDIITETHPTSRIEHNHSIIRLILQKL